MSGRETRDYWRSRGFNDGKKGKRPIFRHKRGDIIAMGDATGFFNSQEELREAGSCYLLGYDIA